ncbi:hypothetical protein [Thaumasiovibrio sp. DFM-14]|uniref:hypothetical protein n=1 Tax=Thaumasiovibrio sp. DFM-14 TaxID=3384792 RepID=UPI0039A1D643
MQRFLNVLLTADREKRYGVMFVLIGLGGLLTWVKRVYSDFDRAEFSAPFTVWLPDVLLYGLLAMAFGWVIAAVLAIGLVLLGIVDARWLAKFKE